MCVCVCVCGSVGCLARPLLQSFLFFCVFLCWIFLWLFHLFDDIGVVGVGVWQGDAPTSSTNPEGGKAAGAARSVPSITRRLPMNCGSAKGADKRYSPPCRSTTAPPQSAMPSDMLRAEAAQRARSATSSCAKAGEESEAPVGSAPKVVGKKTGEPGAAGRAERQPRMRRACAARVRGAKAAGNR